MYVGHWIFLSSTFRTRSGFCLLFLSSFQSFMYWHMGPLFRSCSLTSANTIRVSLWPNKNNTRFIAYSRQARLCQYHGICVNLFNSSVWLKRFSGTRHLAQKSCWKRIPSRTLIHVSILWTLAIGHWSNLFAFAWSPSPTQKIQVANFLVMQKMNL